MIYFLLYWKRALPIIPLFLNQTTQVVSKKPSLITALEAENLVSSFSELQVGMVMVGWVKNIMPYGVFVNFPHGLFGLAPKAVSRHMLIMPYLLCCQ